MTVKHARRYFRIICIIIIVVLAVRWARRPRSVATGVTVYLTHLCRQDELQESNARQIELHYLEGGRVLINDNEYPVDETRSEIQEIMRYRTKRLIWFFGDPQLSYGEVAGNLAALGHDSPGLSIFLVTPAVQKAADSALTPLCAPDGTNESPQRLPVATRLKP